VALVMEVSKMVYTSRFAGPWGGLNLTDAGFCG
jgi:hypothetical protein